MYAEFVRDFNSIFNYADRFDILVRYMSSDKEIKLQVGDVLRNIGESWSDVSDKHFKPYDSSSYGNNTVRLIVDDMEGFKVEYDEVMYEEDEDYQDFMWIINSGPQFRFEAEVLVSLDEEFEVVDVDGTDIYLRRL